MLYIAIESPMRDVFACSLDDRGKEFKKWIGLLANGELGIFTDFIGKADAIEQFFRILGITFHKKQ